VTPVVGAPLQAPSNTAPPLISGSALDGKTLTTSDGTWSGSTPMSFAYQWQRCNTSGAACVPIASTTAKTYTMVSADVGSTLRVVVTASNAAGSAYAAAVNSDGPSSYWRLDDSGSTAADARGLANGTYIGAPQQAQSLLPGDPDAAVSLDGTSQYVEVAGDPGWTPAAFSIEFWVRPAIVPDNRTIAADQSTSLTGWWLNTDPSGALRMFIGNGTAWEYAAAGPTLVPGSTYQIVATYSGSVARLYVNGSLASTGPTVTMSPDGGAESAPARLRVELRRSVLPGVIDDASFYPYALSASQVSAHGAAASVSSAATSAATATVAAAAPVNSSLPVVSGVAQAGQTLSATAGGWSGTAPIGYAYQWQRCSPGCVNVGSNASTYLLSGADVGSTVQVVVTASNTAGSAAATSAQTGTVTAQVSSGTLMVTIASGGDDREADVKGAQSAGYPPAGTATTFATGKVFTAARRLAFGNYGVYVPLCGSTRRGCRLERR
jgi:hypothetical protein